MAPGEVCALEPLARSSKGRPSESLLRSIVDGRCTPRHGRFTRPVTKACWLAGTRRCRWGITRPDSSAATPADEEELQPLTPAGERPSRPVSAHTRADASALTETATTPVRPGSARPATRGGKARPRSSDKRVAASYGYSIGDSINSRPLRLTLADVADEVMEKQDRSKRQPDDKSRAEVSRNILMMKRIVGERSGSKEVSDALCKTHKASSRSMFQTCLQNPGEQRYRRPHSAKSERDSQGLDEFISDSDRGPDKKCQAGSPAYLREAHANLLKDAKRFEHIYACHPQVDSVDPYASAASCSTTASALLTGPRSSPSPCSTGIEGGNSRPSSAPCPAQRSHASRPWSAPCQSQTSKASTSSGLLARAETPSEVHSDQEALISERPRPPERVENPGLYTVSIKTPVLEPPYRSPTPCDEADKAASFRPPRFSCDTLSKWFLAVSKGTEVVTRRELLFALNDNADLFGVFCAADICREKLHGPSNSLTVCGNFKYTQETLHTRRVILRRCIDQLDRINWEYNESRKTADAQSTSSASARTLNFEVFMTYFKYQDMLLEYKDTPELNFVFKILRTKSMIHTDCLMEDPHRGEIEEDANLERHEVRRPSLREPLKQMAQTGEGE